MPGHGGTQHDGAVLAALVAAEAQLGPLAVVALRPGTSASPDELRAYLGTRFAKWWVPDEVRFVDAIPRTSVGKFRKSVLRDTYREAYQDGQ